MTTKNSQNEQVEELAKLMKVYSGFDWGDSDCVRIAEQMIKLGYTRTLLSQPAKGEKKDLDKAEMLKIAHEHYWDSFEEDRGIILKHLDFIFDIICSKFATKPSMENTYM